MTMYATKVWGFIPKNWPLVTFGREGTRNKLRGLWQPGDTMLLIGTMGQNTPESDRGRILGFYEFTSIPVLTRDVVSPDTLQEHGDKWPFALLAVKAWRLDQPPIFKEVLPALNARMPGMALASGFDRLTPEEEAAVRSFGYTQEVVPMSQAAEEAASKTELLGWLKSAQRGPVPAVGSNYEVTRDPQEAKTYLLKLSSKPIMKIGWAIDPTARAIGLSEPLVPALTGDEWVVVLTQNWPDERLAYLMEQAFLDALDTHKITDLESISGVIGSKNL